MRRSVSVIRWMYLLEQDVRGLSVRMTSEEADSLDHCGNSRVGDSVKW